MKYKVVRPFSTSDAFGVIIGRKGAVLEVGVDMHADTAARLEARKLIKEIKPRKNAAEE